MLLINLFILIIYSSIHHKSYYFNRDITRIGILLVLYTLYIQYDTSIITLYNRSIYHSINTISIYNDIYTLNILSSYIILLILILCIISLSNSISILTSLRELDEVLYTNKNYVVIVLFNLIGLVLFTLCNNLIAVYITIELQSYSLYILTSLYTKSNDSLKGGLLYFLIGGIASIIILYGLSILYYITGTLYMNDISILFRYNDTISIGYILLFIGLLIKTGLAPYHNWSISVYNSTPTLITMWISIIAKVSILTYIYNLYNSLNLELVGIQSTISYVLVISIILSLIIGSLGGLIQIKIKPLLMYSGILNGAYLLYIILMSNVDSLAAYIIYITQYSLTHFNIFIILLYIPNVIYSLVEIHKNNTTDMYTNKYSPILYIKQLSNLLLSNKYITISLIISLFSLIGIPPLAGFYGKLYILVTGISEGFIMLSVLLVVCSTISTLYYIYIIKESSIYTNIYTSLKIKTTTMYTMYTDKKYMIESHGTTISYIISTITLMILLNGIQWYNILKGAYMLSIIYL